MKIFKVITACFWTASAMMGIISIFNGIEMSSMNYMLTAVGVVIYAWDEVFS